jgi:hypothetical protein
MLMRLERKMVNIMDHENREVVERFPLHLVREPTAFTSTDPKVRVSPYTSTNPKVRVSSDIHCFQDQSHRFHGERQPEGIHIHRSQGESLPRHIHGCHTKMRVNLDIYGFQDQSHRFQGERQTKGVHIHRS